MSRKVGNGRSPRRTARQLQLERLEDRSVPAVAAFTIELREDLGGSPGDVLPAEAIQAGDAFFVEILAQEFDPLFTGLHGVALNIAWDPQALEEIDSPFNPNSLVTENLPLFQRGTLDNDAGTIDNLSGSAFHASATGRPIGDGGAERFALLHFRAEGGGGETAIRLSEGRSSIVTTPAATFSSAQLSFERQTIEILAQSQAVIETTNSSETNSTPEFTHTSTIGPEAPLAPPAIAETGDEPAVEEVLAVDVPTHYDPFHSSCESGYFVAPAAYTPPAPAALAPIADLGPSMGDFAAAVDHAFIGPLPLEEATQFYLWLDQAIAAIAADVNEGHLRRGQP